MPFQKRPFKSALSKVPFQKCPFKSALLIAPYGSALWKSPCKVPLQEHLFVSSIRKISVKQLPAEGPSERALSKVLFWKLPMKAPCERALAKAPYESTLQKCGAVQKTPANVKRHFKSSLRKCPVKLPCNSALSKAPYESFWWKCHVQGLLMKMP